MCASNARDTHIVHIVVWYRNHMCVNRIFNFCSKALHLLTVLQWSVLQWCLRNHRNYVVLCNVLRWITLNTSRALSSSVIIICMFSIALQRCQLLLITNAAKYVLVCTAIPDYSTKFFCAINRGNELLGKIYTYFVCNVFLTDEVIPLIGKIS